MPGPNPTEPTTILVLFSGSCIIKVKRKNSAREQDVKILERCIQLNRDCATVCCTASQLMSGDSEFVKQICIACAKLYDAWAKSVRNINGWNTANCAHKHVESVLRNVVI